MSRVWQHQKVLNVRLVSSRLQLLIMVSGKLWQFRNHILISSDNSKHYSSYCFAMLTGWIMIIGSQPKNGKMTAVHTTISFETNFTAKVIAITFDFEDGLQTIKHPRPTQAFRAVGFPRMAFLTDNEQGQRVLDLLRRAFQRLNLLSGQHFQLQLLNLP